MSGGILAHYEIREPLSEGTAGTCGAVYRAVDVDLDRLVALRLIPHRNLRPANVILGSDGLARIVDFGLPGYGEATVHEGAGPAAAPLFLTMPYYDGETLRQRLDRGPLPVAAAVDVVVQTARGLAKAHHRGIVHRDIKPANLMLTRDVPVAVRSRLAVHLEDSGREIEEQRGPLGRKRQSASASSRLYSRKPWDRRRLAGY